MAESPRSSDLHGKAQAHIGALDRYDDRQRDQPGPVRHRHRFPLFRKRIHS